MEFGGFPEPFLKAEQRFYNRWRKLRTEQLLREDLRDLTRIQELDQVETLAAILRGAGGATHQLFLHGQAGSRVGGYDTPLDQHPGVTVLLL